MRAAFSGREAAVVIRAPMATGLPVHGDVVVAVQNIEHGTAMWL